MKWIIALVYLALVNTSLGYIIGEKFEDTVYGKPSERTKVEGGEIPKKGFQDRRVYMVTFSSKLGSSTHIVAVSVKTGKIFSLVVPVDSVYTGVEKASYYCEGSVKLPVVAKWPDGLILESEPGDKYRGIPFTISLQTDRDKPTLRVECLNFLYN